MDQIVDGKKRQKLGIQTSKKKLKKPLDAATSKAMAEVEINKDEVLAEEMAKIPRLDPNEALVQTHTAYPWCKKDDVIEAHWNYPQSVEETLRYKVFKDLWEKGFYVTHGEKFGGDFLVYPGNL